MQTIGEGERRVLVFEDGGDEARRWTDELVRGGIACVAARSIDEAWQMLGAGAVSAAVIGAREELPCGLGLGDTRRARVILVINPYSARRVVELSAAADLILPGPLEPGVLPRALELVTRDRDDLAEFARAHRLSPRETSLLRLALSGLNNDEAAATLHCSRATVSTFWNRIFKKTGVRGQRDVMILLLSTYGRKSGLSHADDSAPHEPVV